MKKNKFTEAQIVFALNQADTGTSIAEVCRKMGISEATYYNWKKKYAGLGVTEMRRLRQLEEESRHLKQLVADLSLDNRPAEAANASRCAQKKGTVLRSNLFQIN